MDLSVVFQILGGLKRVFMWVFGYPISIKYLSQFETKKGYVIEAEILTEKRRIINVRKSNICLKIRHDKLLLKETEKGKLIYGESVMVFDSPHTLQAYLEGFSYGNVLDHLRVHKQPQSVLFLIQIEGPGSSNPSSRFQLAKVYGSVEILIRKSCIWLPYLEIPLQKVTIIAGNKNTKIIEEP